MNRAERIFRSYFASDAEYRAFCGKYQVVKCNEDYAGRTGCSLDVLAPDGYVMSFEDKPASVSVGRYSCRNYDYMVSWYGRDPVAISECNPAGLVHQRDPALGPASIIMYGGRGFADGKTRVLHRTYYEDGRAIRDIREVPHEEA